MRKKIILSGADSADVFVTKTSFLIKALRCREKWWGGGQDVWCFFFLILSSVLAFPSLMQGSWQLGRQLFCSAKTQVPWDGSSSCLVPLPLALGITFTILVVIQCWEMSAVLYHWSVGLIQNQNTCSKEAAERHNDHKP